MKLIVVALVGLLFSAVVLSADAVWSYKDARAFWIKKRDTAQYEKYASEFTQFNNYYHLDEKGGCYALGSGPVDLMLVITHSDKSQFAVIEHVLASVDNAKARCFERSYQGVQTKVPPFIPFVLQMGMD